MYTVHVHADCTLVKALHYFDFPGIDDDLVECDSPINRRSQEHPSTQAHVNESECKLSQTGSVQYFKISQEFRVAKLLF